MTNAGLGGGRVDGELTPRTTGSARERSKQKQLCLSCSGDRGVLTARFSSRFEAELDERSRELVDSASLARTVLIMVSTAVRIYADKEDLCIARCRGHGKRSRDERARG